MHQPTAGTPSGPRAEAIRLLGVAGNFLQHRDLNSSRDFAVLAQEYDPFLDGPDQILAVTDVLLASEKRVNNQPDWYAILQIDRRSEDPDIIKKQYRRLALLLHPDKNRFAFSDHAFKLVADAWTVLSDPAKKLRYDGEMSLFSKIDLVALRSQNVRFQQQTQMQYSQQQQSHAQAPQHLQQQQNQAQSQRHQQNKVQPQPQPQQQNKVQPQPQQQRPAQPQQMQQQPLNQAQAKPQQQQNIAQSQQEQQSQAQSEKLPVRRSPRSDGFETNKDKGSENESGTKVSTFWTACPYCYILYEYSRAYEDCCLRCQSCQRAFQAVSIPSLPPLVSGKEAYYCCWGFFPLGFLGSAEGGGKSTSTNAGFPNWMPPMFQAPQPPLNSPSPVVPEAETVPVVKTRGRTRRSPLTA